MTASRRRPREPPTNSATNSSAGAPSTAAGSSYCARRPPSANTATRSPILHRLVDVVGDQQHGLAELALQPQELVLQPAADHRVDRAERLVHQQHGRVGGQGPGHADPLTLAAGELVRVAVGELGRVEADQVASARRARVLRGRLAPAVQQAARSSRW